MTTTHTIYIVRNHTSGMQRYELRSVELHEDDQGRTVVRYLPKGKQQTRSMESWRFREVLIVKGAGPPLPYPTSYYTPKILVQEHGFTPMFHYKEGD